MTQLTEICERGMELLSTDNRLPSAVNLQALLWRLLTIDVPDDLVEDFQSGGYVWQDIDNWHVARFGKNRLRSEWRRYVEGTRQITK